MFGVLRLSRSEIHHSAMMGWLLDPSSRHGLAVSVLAGFLDELGINSGEDPIRVDSVELEVVRGDTRADIVVWTSHVTLVIENKVDADEVNPPGLSGDS
jgi:hypothetical protein